MKRMQDMNTKILLCYLVLYSLISCKDNETFFFCNKKINKYIKLQLENDFVLSENPNLELNNLIELRFSKNQMREQIFIIYGNDLPPSDYISPLAFENDKNNTHLIKYLQKHPEIDSIFQVSIDSINGFNYVTTGISKKIFTVKNIWYESNYVNLKDSFCLIIRTIDFNSCEFKVVKNKHFELVRSIKFGNCFLEE
jgi:hypothetical protein